MRAPSRAYLPTLRIIDTTTAGETSTQTTAATAGAQPDERELTALREVGRAWVAIDRVTRRGDPIIDPDLDARVRSGVHAGDKRVRGTRARKLGLEKIAPGHLQTTRRAAEPKSATGKVVARVRHIVLGAPLETRQFAHERLTKIKALAVLSSDALSSVAYATDQIMLVLVAALVAGYRETLPIMGAILVLLALVVLSYRQTIKAYPKGGGSYIVAKDNIGPLAGLIAGSALMTDYVLTVAVSIASGVSAITSAAPGMQPYTVPMCVAFIVLIVFGNLRGIRESASIFASPTYIFIISIFVMVGTILFKIATGHLHRADPMFTTGEVHAGENVAIFLVLRAFASGCTALTGVEAISDGVPAFKPTEWLNARRTLTIMAVILAGMFFGITLCATLLGLRPDPSGNNILINQLAVLAFGGNILYYVVVVSTVAILVLAANTSFSDFPRLFFFLSRDDYAPHLFKRLGDRLAYSNGIVVLGTLAVVLVIAFKGSVDALIPLYAIGVFLAFTMSQAGMVRRHLRLREPGWRPALVMNFAGMCATAIVLVITASVKFFSGAWIVLVIIPILVMTFRSVHKHYAEVTSYHATETPINPGDVHLVCIVPIADLNGPALQSLALATTMSDTVIAVHINDEQEAIARLRAKWDAWGNHVPLEIIESPYRALVRPLLAYINGIDRQGMDDTIVVILPELVATRWWHQILHNQTALRLKAALLFRPGTVVVNVPYHLRRFPKKRRSTRAKDEGLDVS